MMSFAAVFGGISVDHISGPNIAIIAILLASGLQTIWALKLRRLQLVGTYRVLFVYLLTTAVMSVMGLGLHGLFLRSPSPVTAGLYGWHFVVYQPLSWTLFFCLVVELFRNVLSGFKGLQRLGELAMYVALAGAGAIFLAMIFRDLTVDTWRQFWLSGAGSVYFVLTLICFLLLSFATFFRLAVSRNVKVVFATFGLVFIVEASLFLLPAAWAGLGADETWLITSLLHVTCVAFGTFAFSAAGESVTAASSPRDGARASAALKSFSGTLSRILRS